MAQTKFDICSRALVRIGANPIASFDDGSSEATVAGEEYEGLVQAKLSEIPWRFALDEFTLAKLADGPDGRWTYYYQLPGDILIVRAITLGGSLIDFDRHGDKIATDWDGALVAECVVRLDEAYWPPYFVEAMVAELAAVFASALARNDSLAESNRAQAARAWAKARTIDSQQQTARRFAPGRLVMSRR